MNEIKIAESDGEIEACYDVMAELRPHIAATDFLETIRRMQEQCDYQLAYLSDGNIKAVAGFRIAEWLAGGKYLEIEDLVAKGSDRSNGYGGELFDWIVGVAKRESCKQVKLVSHVRRFDAHRFYLNKRMIIEAHYFSMPL
jgi:GNAT superfamily N-acetyltransferase